MNGARGTQVLAWLLVLMNYRQGAGAPNAPPDHQQHYQQHEHHQQQQQQTVPAARLRPQQAWQRRLSNDAIAQHAAPLAEQPYSTLVCTESPACKLATCPLLGTPCNKGGTCGPLVMSRTCNYKNLYYDSRARSFLFYTKDGKPPCTVMIKDGFNFKPKAVTSLPGAADDSVGLFNTTIGVGHRHHPCFAHSFTEEIFSFWWLAAEHFGSWEFDPPAITRFLQGPTLDRNQKAVKAFHQAFDFQTGQTVDYFARLQKLFINDISFFPGNKQLERFRITRFPDAIAGGDGAGRTFWNSKNYAKRPALAVDAEYTPTERRAAFLHFIERAMNSSGLGPRKSIIDHQSAKIVILNRESGRKLNGASQLLSRLKGTFGEQHVYPKIITPVTMQLPTFMKFLRGVKVLITPHGAHMANTAFMLPGAAVLEIQPAKCASLNYMHAYRDVANYAGVQHRMLGASNGDGCAGSYPEGLNIAADKVMLAVKELLVASSPKASQAMLDEVNRLKQMDTLRTAKGDASSTRPRWKEMCIIRD